MRRTLAICLALALAAGPAAASAPLPVVDTPETPAIPHAVSATCTLEPGPITTSTSYAWTSPDAYALVAWRIPRASCAACPANYGLAIKTVSFRVRWFGPCSATAEVSIVGTTGAAGCETPDLNHVLCPPTSAPIAGTASAGVVHTLTVPAGCCIGADAFVLVRFTGLGSCYPSGPSPGLTAANACVNCKEYVATTVTTPTLTDWCTLAANSIWMQVEADCCGPVGVEDEGHPQATRIVVTTLPARSARMWVDLAGAGPQRVDLSVYDVAGRRVRNLLRGELAAGRHAVEWDGTSDAGARLPAGVYTLRLRAGSAHATATAVLLD